MGGDAMSEIDTSAGARVRHLKRNTTYRVIGTARMQAAAPVAEDVDVIIYRSESDGRMWARPAGEFTDGRFKAIATRRTTKDDVKRRMVNLIDRLTSESGTRVEDLAEAVLSAIRHGDRLPGGLVAAPEKATKRMIAEGESAASYGIGKPSSEDDIPMVWDRMVSAAGG